MPAMSLDDSILAAFNNRDPQAFVIIYDRYYPTVVSYIGRLVKYTPVAKDIANEVFVKIFKNGKVYENSQHVVAALYTISYNSTMDYFRNGKRISNAIEELRYLQLQEQQAEEGGLGAFTSEDFIQWALKELESLPEKQRTAIKLRFLEDLTVKEVGKQMNIDPSSVYTNIAEGLKKLRVKFAQQFFQDPE
jgi:RNA polymerase sigma-70 factor, ECF subfamily